MYEVKNKTNEPRQFWDTFKGSNIIVGAGQSVLTSKPPVNGNVWEVKLQQKRTANRESSIKSTSKSRYSRKTQENNEENIEIGSSN